MISAADMKEIRKEVAYWMRRLYSKGLTTCSGGNISFKFENHVYITASQSDKGRIKSDGICIINADGENITKDLTPSMETGMHLAVYRSNPEIKAVVHAHPVKLSALCCLNRPVNNIYTGEQRYILGEIGVASYKIMGSKALADEVALLTNSHKAVLMQNHGALTVGRTLFEAFDRMEVFESLASQILYSLHTDSFISLSEQEIEAIDCFNKKNED